MIACSSLAGLPTRQYSYPNSALFTIRANARRAIVIEISTSYQRQNGQVLVSACASYHTA
jgi:hypothetical protein